jgi:hypothetical protein
MKFPHSYIKFSQYLAGSVAKTKSCFSLRWTLIGLGPVGYVTSFPHIEQISTSHFDVSRDIRALRHLSDHLSQAGSLQHFGVKFRSKLLHVVQQLTDYRNLFPVDIFILAKLLEFVTDVLCAFLKC